MASRTWRWLALAGVVGVAAAVRCYRLDAPILSHDEAFSWRLTQYPVGELCMRTGRDVHPPLYYVVLQAWDGVFGDSEWALRGLSVLFGIAAVLLAYAVCLEALRKHAESSDEDSKKGSDPENAGGQTPFSVQTGALLVALLVAISSGQVDASRNARMYGLGVLLAGASAWLLLRACRADEGRWSWWAAYGTAAALFCYTHNYAFFTLFGQGLFVAGLVGISRQPEDGFSNPSGQDGLENPSSGAARSSRSRILLGFGYAALLALILYLPWVPVLLEQMRQVKLNYWMQQVNVRILDETLFRFGTGMPYEGEWASLTWLTLLGGAMALAVWRAPRAALFFLVQAFAPLVLSVALSLASGRSIFHDHLFVFAQLSLIGFWGVVWTVLPGWPERLAFGVAVAGAASVGLATNLSYLPGDRPAIAEAAAFLERTAQPGDEIWTGSPWELNHLRYYLAQAGAENLKVRCRCSFPGQGHMVHIASVSAEEVIWAEAEARQPPPNRLWMTGNAFATTPAMRVVLQREFGGEGNRKYTLSLYEANVSKSKTIQPP